MNIDFRDSNPIYHDNSLVTIAYFNGKRIVKDSVDNLYYEIIPFSAMQVTDVLNMDRLSPVSDLLKEEQAMIQEYLVNKES